MLGRSMLLEPTTAAIVADGAALPLRDQPGSWTFGARVTSPPSTTTRSRVVDEVGALLHASFPGGRFSVPYETLLWTAIRNDRPT